MKCGITSSAACGCKAAVEAKLPVDSRRNNHSVCVLLGTELVGSRFSHAQSGRQDIGQRWSRNLLLLSGGQCSP